MTSSSDTKVFIIGLPRTGTTSLCKAMLDLGFTVAHTAYTQKAFDLAQVIADTPIFCDFKQLASQYPNARFIYLNRSMDKWIPSIKQLLLRMHPNLVTNQGGFNPIIKRCYAEIFPSLSINKINNDDFLKDCFSSHKQQVLGYFLTRPEKLLTIDISKADSYLKLTAFLQITPNKNQPINKFEKLNIGGKVTAWKDIKHPNKVASVNEKGQADKVLW